MLKPMPQSEELSRDIWRIFHIISEFVDGFENFSQADRKMVSVFGSARTPEKNPLYAQAVEAGRLLAEAGFGVITGGGPGIMEAANRGAKEAGGLSVGLNIELPREQVPNPYQNLVLSFRYFFVRKYMFVKYSDGFILFPGGFGTGDELLETLCLIQTRRSRRVPLVLVGREYWQGIVEWMKEQMVGGEYIDPEDLELFKIVDTPVEAVAEIVDFHGIYSPSP